MSHISDLPLPMVRINPPIDVQQKIGAAMSACAEWKPVLVDKPSPETTTEASVCGLLDNWPHNANALAYEFVFLGAVCCIVGYLILRTAYRATRAGYRILRGRLFELRPITAHFRSRSGG